MILPLRIPRHASTKTPQACCLRRFFEPVPLAVPMWITRHWPARLTEGKIYGEQENGTDVVDDQMPFHLKKQRVSRYVIRCVAPGVVALPLDCSSMDGVLWSV